VAEPAEIRQAERMASLQPTRKILWDDLCRAMLDAGTERHRVKEGQFDAFVKVDEISLALAPALRIRHGKVHLECGITAIDREFERSVGCEPFQLCSFRTFGAYYANFDEFYRSSWIDPDRSADDLRLALSPYLDLIARYPRTRSAMSTELRSGSFGGLSLKYFMPSPKTKAFLDWLGASGSFPLPN
jgi:hypothetical protein